MDGTLYFLSTRVDNKPQIFRLPVAGGEAEQISKVPTGVGGYVLSPDGKTIAITAKRVPCLYRYGLQREDGQGASRQSCESARDH